MATITEVFEVEARGRTGPLDGIRQDIDDLSASLDDLGRKEDTISRKTEKTEGKLSALSRAATVAQDALGKMDVRGFLSNVGGGLKNAGQQLTQFGQQTAVISAGL